MFKILDSPSGELREIQSQLDPQGALHWYANAILATEHREINFFQTCVPAIASSKSITNNHKRDLIDLIQLRHEIVSKRPEDRTISLVQTISDSVSPWRGEAEYLLALAFHLKRNEVLSCEFYRRASRTLESQGSPRKGLLAELNAIQVSSQINPTQSYTNEYTSVANKATQLQCHEILATASLALSREYELSDNLQEALSHITTAVEGFDLNSLNYNVALCHRARLLLKMRRLPEADQDIQAVHSAGALPQEVDTLSRQLQGTEQPVND